MKKQTEINPKCSDRLKKLLSGHNTTQTELCKMTGISMNTISKICNGKSPLTPYVAGEIVKCFPGTRYEWLMGNDEFETELLLQGYKTLRPYMEKKKREKAVSSFFRSLSLSFSLNVPDDPKWKLSTDEFISRATDKELEKAFTETGDILHSPNAYVIEKDGEAWGYCSVQEKEALFEEIFDFAEFSLLKLCNKEKQNNG